MLGLANFTVLQFLMKKQCDFTMRYSQISMTTLSKQHFDFGVFQKSVVLGQQNVDCVCVCFNYFKTTAQTNRKANRLSVNT